MATRSMGGHQSATSRTNTWITPKELLMQLGEFDLDPCAAVDQPWPTAKVQYTELDDGLGKAWFGRVWCNPPYATELIKRFMQKMAQHGNGIALTFARTDTEFFQDYVLPVASSALFVRGRINFCNIGGMRGRFDGGAPSVLIAYGEYNSQVLAETTIRGRHVPLNYTPVIVVGVSPTWISVVTIAVRHHGDTDLKAVYDMVERMAPDKVAGNMHWKEKIRQQVQIIRKRK